MAVFSTPKSKSTKIPNDLVFRPEPINYSDWKCFDRNFEKLQKIDAEAKTRGLLVGRYIQEQIADGYAFYQIIKETARKVTISVLTGLGDDWVISYWGECATIDKAYAENSIRRREGLAKLFSKAKG